MVTPPNTEINHFLIVELYEKLSSKLVKLEYSSVLQDKNSAISFFIIVHEQI